VFSLVLSKLYVLRYVASLFVLFWCCLVWQHEFKLLGLFKKPVGELTH